MIHSQARTAFRALRTEQRSAPGASQTARALAFGTWSLQRILRLSLAIATPTGSDRKTTWTSRRHGAGVNLGDSATPDAAHRDWLAERRSRRARRRRQSLLRRTPPTRGRGTHQWFVGHRHAPALLRSRDSRAVGKARPIARG